MASTRRLVAIMFTDTVDFTAAAQVNEAEALRLREEQETLLRPLFPTYQGRCIKSTGDGFLVVFDSALRAVQCALGIQELLRARNSPPGVPPIRLRIGVHLGDVEERAGDIGGDAVNVASRIEPLAEPGGICITEPVFGLVRNKIPNRLDKLEPKSLKGVLFPLDVYRIDLTRIAQRPISPAVAVGALDKNRVAVLPFVNISPDPHDEYFADGLTEELIASLSGVLGLKVIARTSVMNYKTQPKHVSRIGEELGVGTVVEGSVRRSANRIRVTVQVIDTATGEHRWAAKYDDDLDDIFAVQTDIAGKVAAALPASISGQPARVSSWEGTPDLQAYLYYLQGQTRLGQRLEDPRGEEPFQESLRFFELALERVPDLARAYVGKARVHFWRCNAGLEPWPAATQSVRGAAEKALSINPELAEAHYMLAESSIMVDDLEAAAQEANKALELNPNLAEAHRALVAVAAAKGDLESLTLHSEQSYQLDPLSPLGKAAVASAYTFAGRLDDAEEYLLRILPVSPPAYYGGMLEVYVARGDLELAEAMMREVERMAPTDPYTYRKRGMLAARQGDIATAKEMITKLSPNLEPGTVGYEFAGHIYLALGDLGRFFEHEFASAKYHTVWLAPLRLSSWFSVARKDPRFEQLLAVAGPKPRANGQVPPAA